MQPEVIFYDGHCGLCHGAVRLAVRADRDGSRFRFAPLGGETFRAQVPEERRAGLPDSIIVMTRSGELLTKSTAVAYMLKRLGGAWRVAGAAVEVFPLRFRDAVYDWLAQVRRRLFGRPVEVCPLVPPHLRERFKP